jgi:hypothetical protein
MTTPKVIGIYANGIGAGKSTVAALLADKGFKVLPFAAPMKDMVVVLLEALGHDPGAARLMVTDQYRKKQEVPGIGKTPRDLLRTLGTEWGRNAVCNDLWLQCWEARARQYLRSGHSVVCDDVRFLNEIGIIESLPNAEIWRVDWEGAETSDHPSDNGIPSSYEPDLVIENNEGLEELHIKVVQGLGL